MDNKLIKLSYSTSIAGIVSSSIYILLTLAFVVFMIKEISIDPTEMGIMVLFFPVAIAYGIVGGFALRASIRLLKAAKARDIRAVNTALQKNLVFAILLTIGGAWFLGVMVFTAPAAITYLILDILASSTAKKIPVSSTNAAPVK